MFGAGFPMGTGVGASGLEKALMGHEAWSGRTGAGAEGGYAGRAAAPAAGGGCAIAGSVRCQGDAGPALGSSGWSANLGPACYGAGVGIVVGGGASDSKAFSDTSGRAGHRAWGFP